MVKRVVIFSLADGKDPDEVWKYYETHAANYKKMPGIRKYVINRVTKAAGGIPFWGMSEFWFDSEEAYNRARSSTARPKDDFHSMHGVMLNAWVEEKVIV